MRLIKKYYSFRYEDFDFITFYLTQIKTLEKRIHNINVILDNNKQILLCFDMILPKRFQFFIKIWIMTLRMITNKARSMLLEKERYEKSLNFNTVRLIVMKQNGKRDARKRFIINDIIYSRYEKDYPADIC